MGGKEMNAVSRWSKSWAQTKSKIEENMKKLSLKSQRVLLLS